MQLLNLPVYSTRNSSQILSISVLLSMALTVDFCLRLLVMIMTKEQNGSNFKSADSQVKDWFSFTCVRIHRLVYSKDWVDRIEALSTQGAQILISCLSLKGTWASWRKSWFTKGLGFGQANSKMNITGALKGMLKKIEANYAALKQKGSSPYCWHR